MARNVLPIIGQAIGAYFGGPWGAAIGQAIGTVVGNAVDPLVIDGPKIGEVAQQTSSEGVYQPIYFGTSQGAGNIVAQGPNVVRRRRESQGKGGGPVTVIETLYKTFAIRIGVSWLGETGIVGISRIWENGKLVYDVRPGSTIVSESAKFATKFRLYKGTDTQVPDPALEVVYGVGNTPSYRGRAYIVFPLYDITQWKAIPQYSFEVVTGGTSTPPVQVVATGGPANPGFGGYLDSPDGLDFSGPWQEASALQSNTLYLMASSDLYIAHGFSGHPAYRDGNTGEWQLSTGDSLNGVGGAKLGWVSPTEDVVLIPGGLGNNGLRSLDRGRTYTQLSGTLGHNAYIHVHVQFVGFFNGGIYTSLTNGESWSLHATTIVTSTLSLARWSSPTTPEGFFAGSTGFPFIPAIAYTTDGFIWSDTSFPELSLSQSFSCGCMGIIPDDENYTWVLFTAQGECIVRHPIGTWEKSSYVMPVRPFDITHNGVKFYAIGGAGPSGDTEGLIISSADGLSWDIERSEAINTELWSGIEALALTGGGVVSESPTLDQVIDKIHELCLQPSSEYDVSQLSDILVMGYILAGGYTGKEAINTLQNLWTIDSPEYDKVIHYRKRGADVVSSYTFDDLIDEPEEATREQAIEFPKKLHLDYQSPDVDYAPAKATSSRSSIDARVIGEVGVQVPVVLTPTEAFQRANVLHKVSWTDSDGDVVFSIPDENLHLVPGDCISLFLRDNIRRLRIDLIDYYPGKLKLTCRSDRQSAYTSNVEGLSPPPPTPPPPSLVGPTLIVVGDWPLLRDQDDISTPVKYIAMGGISPAWSGALGEQSVDGGNTYSDMVEVYSGAIMGTLQEYVSDAAPYFTDTTNIISIQLDIQDGSVEIDSLTQSQFLNKMGGFALVKEDGTSELMQFRDASDLGDGLYELSYLQRGRLNTETHEFFPGDRFVLLETVAVVTAPTSQIGLDVYYRATSFGLTTEEGTVTHDEYEANSQTEWPVAEIIIEKTGSLISGTIVPRHRLGTEINPIRSINWSSYTIVITDSLMSSETISQTSDSFTYDAASMTFPVTVTVHQVNRLTGIGPGKSEEIQ
jgi:hypothetical protein